MTQIKLLLCISDPIYSQQSFSKLLLVDTVNHKCLLIVAKLLRHLKAVIINPAMRLQQLKYRVLVQVVNLFVYELEEV